MLDYMKIMNEKLDSISKNIACGTMNEATSPVTVLSDILPFLPCQQMYEGCSKEKTFWSNQNLEMSYR